ncbi:MAG: hypothetical protein SRB2_00218 [Desulfobacteraceae bacterium Eth-SRB2]|nr:MAG: hypothetical protein SRB2_00218 [Desulfobacteraceae bacterium Eth-SRB2]
MEETPFFHRSQKTDPWRKSESLKLFFFKSTLQYSITPLLRLIYTGRAIDL